MWSARIASSYSSSFPVGGPSFKVLYCFVHLYCPLKKVLHRSKCLLIYPVRSLLFPITCMIMLFSLLLKCSGWTSPPFCFTGSFNAPSVSDLWHLVFVVFSIIYCSLGFVSLFWLVLFFLLFLRWIAVNQMTVQTRYPYIPGVLKELCD